MFKRMDIHNFMPKIFLYLFQVFSDVMKYVDYYKFKLFGI